MGSSHAILHSIWHAKFLNLKAFHSAFLILKIMHHLATGSSLMLDLSALVRGVAGRARLVVGLIAVLIARVVVVVALFDIISILSKSSLRGGGWRSRGHRRICVETRKR